jgi:hypothetical protein
MIGPALKNIFYLSSYLDIDEKDDLNKCVFCGSLNIVMPMQIKSCSHKGCYYCVKSMEQADIKCKLCGT